MIGKTVGQIVHAVCDTVAPLRSVEEAVDSCSGLVVLQKRGSNAQNDVGLTSGGTEEDVLRRSRGGL